MNESGLLRAPADRPVGARGVRAWVAAILAVAGVVALGWADVAEDPDWTRVPLFLAALALFAAAVLAWIARGAAGLGLAAALLLLAIGSGWVSVAAHEGEVREQEKWGGAVWTIDEKGPAITRQQAEAVPKSATKDEVRAMLGPAAGSGIQRVNDGRDLRCVAYRNAERGHRTGQLVYALCFTGGRYTDLREW